jgi:glutathione synthase/RimK-type ligase-like ATP-grasp enzyme
MKRVAILTPDPADEAFHSRWRDVFERNAEPLREAGLAVEDRSWGEAEDLAEFDLVLPLLVWGYVRAYDRWLESVERWEREGVRLQNPPSVMRWNADKSYLGRLADRGAPVVPARYVDRVTPEIMAEAARAFGTGRLVAKPRISHSAWQTIRWSPGDSLEGGPAGAAIVQPYLERIETSGELSLLWFAGRFSHAIRKVPQPGDFRVQPEYDGIITACRPENDEMEAARRVMAAVGEELLYARIDLARGPDGAPALIELELIEPDLYLGYDAAGARSFAAAVMDFALRTREPYPSTWVATASQLS